jgi:Initiation factor 2 subunit family
MIYARSSAVINLLLEAAARGLVFRVIVVDSRPCLEGTSNQHRQRNIEGIIESWNQVHLYPYTLYTIRHQGSHQGRYRCQLRND